MRILAAFDKFKDSFTADEACCLLKNVAEELSPNFQIIPSPLTDGGEGFVHILTQRYAGEFLETKVSDSLGESKTVSIGMIAINELSQEVRSFLNLPDVGKIAIIEMASVCGLGDLAYEQRNPFKTSTIGVGQLLLFAKQNDADFILLGIGGSCTNDGGIGALTALGLNLINSSGDLIKFPSPESWEEISSISISNLESLPPLIVACDVNNPLLGSDGATYQFGPQKGLPTSKIAELEKAMSGMVLRLKNSFPQAPKLSKVPGSGAAGGIGFGLSLAGKVKLVPGFELVSSWLGLEQEVSKVDLIFTGEGRFDKTSLRGKGPFEIFCMAKKAKKKAILLCGSFDPTTRQNSLIEFPEHQVLSFANDSWKLKKNLKYGPELFSETCRSILKNLIREGEWECPTKKEARFKRIRRLKRFLRPLPRRSNVHRYPVLKWFADTAYKRSFLWSFKGKPVQSALFWGIWVSMLPIVGIQMLVVFFVSLLVRANLPLIVGLQWISNPLTMGPIYFADYKIGMILLKLIGVDYPQNKLLSAQYDWAEFSFKELLRLLDTFPPMLLGGSVLGIFFGVSTVFLYKFLSKFYKN